MLRTIRGKAYVLGNDIDTDQIIPARHLVYNLDDPDERRLYGHFALSGIPEAQAGLPEGHVPFIDETTGQSPFQIIIGGKNFGCGSSREHAPVALTMAGVSAVVAPSYARIFYRNSIDGGFIMPLESRNNLMNDIRTGDEVEIDRENNILKNITTNKIFDLNPLGDVADIIDAGGIFAYAREKGRLASN